MLGIAVELLTGRYAATAYNDRDKVEWPPHPARLFSALVAVQAETTEDEAQGQRELEALRWLEEQAPPDILASHPSRTAQRTVVPVFVPVNDVSVVRHPSRDNLDRELAAQARAVDATEIAKADKRVDAARTKLQADTKKACAATKDMTDQGLKNADAMLLDRRGRQPRTFPVAIPEWPHVLFVWPDVNPSPAKESALRSLLGRLSRLGHSSSLVHGTLVPQERVEAMAPRADWCVPDDAGSTSIRWVVKGQVDRLDRAYALHQQTQPRVLPARFVNYRWGRAEVIEPVAGSCFAPDFMVFARVSGPRLPATSVVGLANQVRRALMSCADQPPPEILSGHGGDGGASDRPHLAIAPLPYVSGRFADGSLLGLALILPRDANEQERKAVLRAVARMESQGAGEPLDDSPTVTIHLGTAGDLVLRRVVWGEDKRRTLQARSWTHASRHWATASPIALDRNPGDLHDPDARRRAAAFEEAATIIQAACQRVGLPAPTHVDVLRSCVLPGSAKPRHYPRFPAASSRPQRVLVHARLTFDAPVTGPVLLGSGRYFGLGLCAPVDGDS